MKMFMLPDWTKPMPSKACLNSKEVADIFGYSTIPSLGKALDRGLVPKCDRKVGGSLCYGRAKSMWSLGYLRSFESKLIEINKLEAQLLSMCKGLEGKDNV